jgi:hypothetical protein
MLLGGEARGSRERVQLVHRAVGFDSQRVFGQALSAYKRRLTAIAGLGVDAIQREPRLIELLLHESNLPH